MGIKQTLDVINDMEREGVIGRYAIGGAVAAYNYVEPAVTEDLDILVSFEKTSPSGLVSLQPILEYLRHRGYMKFDKEGVLVEGWPVQFLPVASPLDDEALAKSEKISIRANGGKVQARLLLPEHLVAIAVQLGRPKDHLRITQFLQEKAVNLKRLKTTLARHKLDQAWKAFCKRTGTPDPLAPK